MTASCLHPSITILPGEPTIGPYYSCDVCGRQLSEAEFDLAANRIATRRRWR